MTEAIDFHRLKTLAKRYARANRLALHQSLDLIAERLGFSNWVKLAAASKRGWQPSPEQLTDVEAFVAAPLSTILHGNSEAMRRRLEYLQDAVHGTIGDSAYTLQGVLDDVIMAGEGWSIRVPENPSAAPIVETYVSAETDCPIFDPDFLKVALEIAKNQAARVRAGIATDWPRRSTKPDKDGVVRHPLGNSRSAFWFCLHCDGKITGTQIAQNLWHCPGCGASPLDIFDSAFWSDDGGRSFLPVEMLGTKGQGQSDVQIVDGRPKLDLSADKVILLIRSALLDDATNVSEQLGAIEAVILVDDDCVFVTLRVDLWPDDKEPIAAFAVAQRLGLELEVDASMFQTPFAWPDLGTIAKNTTEYTEMMLDAYAQYDGLPKKESETP